MTSAVGREPALLLAHGDDGFLLGAAVDEFAAATGAMDRTDLAPERSPDEAQIDRARVAAASVPLFGGSSLVVLRQPLRCVGRSPMALARLVETIETLPPGAALALVEQRSSRDGGKASPTLQRLADAVKARGGGVVERNAPRRNELAPWIVRHAQAAGIDIDRRAAALLAERVGGAVWESDIERGEQTRRAANELRKLAAFAGERTIRADDVAALVADDRPASIFAITNALERRDPVAAAEALSRALAEGQPELLIMATVQSRVADLIVARDLVARRVPTAQLVQRLRRPARAVERLADAARRYTGAELEAMLIGLFDADIAIKTNAVEPAAALTAWFGRHVAAAGRRQRDAGRLTAG